MRLMYINGQFTQGSATETIDVHNPATEDMLDSVPRGTPADVSAAVSAAQTAFDEWRRLGANQRARLLHTVSEKVRARSPEIARLLTLEEGKPLSENEEEVDWVANTFDYYAELGRHERGRATPHKIKRFFEDVKAGTIWINDPLTDNYGGPFGGMRMSGGARELGPEGLDEFRETKHVHWDLKLEDKSYWYPYGRE
jgi:acyl-CoA reductase-like NAD-dependent aldehyde dehydrogenase